MAAVILAGGEGQRLGGVVKANIEIAGARLLDRVAAVLRRGASPILVAHGRLDAATLELPPDMVLVPDPPGERRGPLAGLAAAIEWIAAQRPDIPLLASAAVDTPFLPPDFLGRLLEEMAKASADVVMAQYGGQPYPTNALWRISAFAGVPAAVRSGHGPFSLKRLAAASRGAVATWPIDPDSPGDPFANVNTPDDLESLARRAIEAGR